MNNEMWLYLVGQILAAAGIYTAIRVDLKGHDLRIGFLEKQNEKRKCP